MVDFVGIICLGDVFCCVFDYFLFVVVDCDVLGLSFQKGIVRMNNIMVCFSLIFGVVVGFLIVVMFVWSVFLLSEDWYVLEWVGYLMMIVVFLVIFIGIKCYCDWEFGGVIKFGQGLLFGFGIFLVVSVIYVVGWEFYLVLIDYVFIEDYSVGVIVVKKEVGLVGLEFEEFVVSMEEMKVIYVKLFYWMLMIFFEIFLIGFFVFFLLVVILCNCKVLLVWVVV